MPANTLFCPKCGKSVPDDLRKQGKFQFWVSIVALILFFATSIMLAYVAWDKDMPEKTKEIFYLIMSISAGLFGLLFLVLLAFMIMDLVQYMIRHKIFAVIFCVLILAAGGTTAYFIIKNNTDDYFSNSIKLIQNNLAELEALKITGDSATTQKKLDNAIMTKIKIMSKMVAERLADIKVPESLTDYKQSVIDRGNKIAEASQDKNTWQNLPNQSNELQLELTDEDIQELVEESKKGFAMIKEFGDTAIQRNDKDTMRYLAAKLLVQEQWLNLLSGTEEVDKIIQSINEIETSAVDFVNGEKDAEDKWNQSWQNVETTLGVTFAAPTIAEHSPSVQAFYDECAEKGGTVGGEGTAKTNLPTTEFGYTCEYKYKSFTHGEQSCWDFLTYSGGRYMGGNNGCPTENLLPSITELEDQQTEENKTTSNWDGTYPVSTTANCVSDIPQMPSAIPVQTTITVSGNVGNDEGTTFLINSDGNGTEVLRYGMNNENGSVNMIGIINYQFFMDGGTPKFNAIANLNGNALVNGQVYTFSCSATTGSTRQ